MSDLTQPKLSALLSKRLHKIIKVPSGFPNVQFDWVSEENLRKLERIEASAPGSWDLPHNRRVHDIVLKADVPEEAPEITTTVTLDADFELGPHRFHGVAKFPGEFEFTAKLSNFALEHFLQSMASASDLLEQIPAFWFREADLVFNPATVAFQFHGWADQNWTLPIGVNGLPLTDIELILTRAAGRPMTAPLQGELRGILNIADAKIPVSHIIGEAVSAFTGDVSRLDMSLLIQQLCDGSCGRRIPFLYQPQLGRTEVTVSVEQRVIYLKSQPTGKFGESEWLIEKRGGVWGYSLSPKLPGDWKLHRLAPFLFEFNRLTLSETQLAISMFSDRAELFPEWPEDAADHLGEGMKFVSTVALNGLPELETAAKICRLSGKARMLGTLADLPDGRELVLKSSIANFTLAQIADFKDPVLQLRHASDKPYQVSIVGGISVTPADGVTLEFEGEAEVSRHQVSLTANLNRAWNQPYEVRGVVVERLTLDITTDAITGESSFILAGRSRLGVAQGSARVLWGDGIVASQLRLGFDRLPAAVIVSELAPPGAKLPPEARATLDGGFRDVEITSTPGASALSGKLQVMGSVGEFMGSFAEDSGLRAFGSLAPLRWMRVAGARHVIELTRGEPDAFASIDPDAAGAFPGGEVGPLIRLALGTESPGVQLSATATLFTEFDCAVFAETTKKGAAFPYSFQNDAVRLELQCQIDEGGLQAVGEIQFSIDTRLDLVEPKTGVRFATLPFEASLVSKISLNVGAKFEAVLNGELTWNGQQLPLQKAILTETPTAFADFKQAVVDIVRQRAFAMLFKTELGKPDGFFNAVRDGWLHTGRALDLSSSQLTQSLRNAISPTPANLAVVLRELGYTWAEIASALNEQVRLSAESAAKPMEQAGASANEVAEALYLVYRAGADVCAMALHGAGFDHLQTGAALNLSCDAPPAQLAKALRGAGCSAVNITQVLRNICQTPLDMAYRAMHHAGFKAPESMQALRNICDSDREETEHLLTQGGWSPREVRSTIDKSFETLGGLIK